MAISMAAADGKYAEEEKNAIFFELATFGVTKTQFVQILTLAQGMKASEAFATIACMDDEQKKYVTGYLAVIMVADGDIDDSEVKMWQLISLLAQLPTMSINDALDFWRSHL